MDPLQNSENIDQEDCCISWNMDTFFKGLNEHLNLEEIDAEDGIASEIRKKISK